MAKLMSFFSPPEEEILGLHDVHPRRIREARARDVRSPSTKVASGTPSTKTAGRVARVTASHKRPANKKK
ncbi:MAG: hypothetical protein MJE68_10230 [Proteobacteria bacterium]|nr:hypothetical protein [Pseudomonadota bacterium]